jgi:hypothetical protein
VYVTRIHDVVGSPPHLTNNFLQQPAAYTRSALQYVCIVNR